MSNEIRNYKDNVFCLIHRDKGALLELYNAMNGTHYTSTEGLEVVTLPNAIYMRFKNDAAFTFNDDLTLAEQQSTKNSNMGLRFLHYISEEYRRIIPTAELHRTSKIGIPTPHFVVFYNGTDELAERSVCRLSDLYENPTDDPELELKVLVLNINDGYNRELMSKCKTLSGYMRFVGKVRENNSKKGKNMTLEEAVRTAVEDCIKEDILADFFREHKEEVISVCLLEYNEEAARQASYTDGLSVGDQQGYIRGREDGHAAGKIEGKKEGIKEGIKEGKKEGIKEGKKEGIKEGQMETLRSIVSHALSAGKSLDEIADFTGEEPSVIENVVRDLKARPMS